MPFARESNLHRGVPPGGGYVRSGATRVKPSTGPALTSRWAPPGMSRAADPHTFPVALTHASPELVGTVGGGWWLLERRMGVGDGALVGAGGDPAPNGAAGGSSMGGSMGAGPNHVLGPVSRADRALLQRGGWPRGDPLPAVSPSLTYTGDASCLGCVKSRTSGQGHAFSCACGLGYFKVGTGDTQ